MSVLLWTGPTGSGKSTSLDLWSRDRPGTAGILSLRAGGGDERCFTDILTRRSWPMQPAGKEGEDTFAVGRFCFSKEAFRQAGAVLEAGMGRPDVRCLVLDEVGPLELRGQGFAPLLPVLAGWAAGSGMLVLVVRDSLAARVSDWLSGFPHCPSVEQLCHPADRLPV